MPLIATRGAASAQGFGEFAQSAAPVYIEDVMSVYLYTGNDSVQTITNGIDLAGKGGLIWLKKRNNTSIHGLWDTARGGGSRLDTSSTAAPGSVSPAVTFNSNGFTLPAGGSSYLNESSTNTYASWTFRKQPKFFDVVTYTGTGSARTVAHNLGSAPGFIIIKRTDAADEWFCYHRSIGAGSVIYLNLTNASNSAPNMWNNTAPTSTVFTVGTDSGVNGSGATYVAYLFAHNAGGFGLTGADNVISCGSFTTDGSENSTTNLGYEPQWLLLKASSGATSASQPWRIFDNMRGLTVAGQDDASLQPNNSNAESQVNRIGITSTGFTTNAFGANETFIYIAIRRGPMKTPTSGTSVFRVPYVRTGGGATQDITAASYPVNDLVVTKSTSNTQTWAWTDRLRGATLELTSAGTTAETAYANDLTSFAFNTGFQVGSGAGGQMNTSGYTYIDYTFRRAPGFFDVVCWAGNDVAPRNIDHNLTVVPEMMIVKRRSGVANWVVYHKNLPSALYYLSLNATNAQSTGTNVWRSTAPTATVFTVGNDSWVNTSSDTYVNYLFASCPGVSKVGSYTGNGTSQTINCGFTGGARFVLIKRTDSTGDWYVWDSARGIVAGNDPYLLLNSTAAEVTNTDYIDTYSAGFEISSTAPAAINANGGTFIFLAIA